MNNVVGSRAFLPESYLIKMNTNAWNRIRYSIISPFYNAVVAPFSRSRKRSLELLNPQPGEKLLILGCGTGSDLEFIPVDIDVTAVDITPAMVQMTRNRAQELHRNIDARVMDGQSLKFEDAAFDGVILHLILAVIPNPHACIREAERVLKPGGRVVIWDKFLPDHANPSLFRHLLNVVTGTLFSEINRQLGVILVSAPALQIAHSEKAEFGGAYKIVLLRKLGNSQ